MKITNLEERPQLYPSAITLIEKAFKYDPHHSFAEDFAPLMNKVNFKHCWLLLEQEALIGHIGARLIELNNGLKGAMLGGIAVDENYRGQGHLKTLLNSVIERYQAQDFLILWSDQHELYQKFDFKLSGTQYTLGKTEGIQSSFTKCREITPLIKEEVQRLYRLLSQDELTIVRSKNDWELLWQITSADLYLAYEGRNLASYFFMNKGQDLTGIIHESYFPHPNYLEAATTLGTLWLTHYHEPFAEYAEKLGLIRFNQDVDLTTLWISGLDSI